MRRRITVLTLGLILLLALTSACAPVIEDGREPPVTDQKTSGEGVVTEREDKTSVDLGTIEFRVTDPPPADVKSAVVYLSNVEVHKASTEQEMEQVQSGSGNQTQEQEQTQQSEGEWITVVGAPPSFDLMDVIGVDQLLGSAEVTPGKYTQIRMDVDRVEVETVDGDTFTAEVPSGKLKVVRPFSVGEGLTTILTLDFDGEKSLIITGKGKAIFKPVVKLLIKEKEEKGVKTKEASEEEESEELEFEGTIDAIDGDIWTMTIDGESRAVDVSEAVIEGEPAVGLEAEVKGIVVDDTIITSEVEIREAD